MLPAAPALPELPAPPAPYFSMNATRSLARPA
jgi:hypothetical protein